MPLPKTDKSKNGETMHYSVGAVIMQNKKYLLIDRAIPPFGFAGPAGHIDQNETPEIALYREVSEETGLKILDYKLLLEEEIDWNTCNKGINTHYWYLYECTVLGQLIHNELEAKTIGWYSKDEIKNLKLEPVWAYWFKKLSIID